MTCSTAFLALDFGAGLTSLNWVAQAIQTRPKAGVGSWRIQFVGGFTVCFLRDNMHQASSQAYQWNSSFSTDRHYIAMTVPLNHDEWFPDQIFSLKTSPMNHHVWLDKRYYIHNHIYIIIYI